MNELTCEAWRTARVLLRAAATQTDLPPDCDFSPENLCAVYAISARYDLAHMIAVPLLRGKKLDQDSVAPFQSAMYNAVMRCEQMDYEMKRMAAVFDQEKIPYLPLKGAVIRAYYPEPWMRTSCDMDILVHEGDLNRAIDCLKADLAYTQTGRTAHDVSLNAGSRVHIELHYDTIEGGRAAVSNRVLANIWDHAAPVDGGFRYVLDNAMFDFYHIAHMAKHFENGGCGVRPFLDLWLLNRRNPDKSARNALLEQGGLLKFAGVCDRLSEVWFGDGKADEVTDALSDFILGAGMYGSVENMVAVQKNQDGGRLRYIFHRLFMPYDKIKKFYPVLQRHKWLTPVMQVRRWVKMITDGRMNRTVRELQSLKSGGEANAQTQRLLENLGLGESEGAR